ncbi:MAG: winged helix DNA-binding protein [Thaumarchaeota archaeon]|nr:MAG: winged helix DNA-binding protein [Nitrososphaerota archaeon]
MKDQEILFVGTAEAEHVEMYLKAIWHIKESGDPVKISTIAKMLNVRQPSVVQMLKKLNEAKLVNYNKSGVSLTKAKINFEIGYIKGLSLNTR